MPSPIECSLTQPQILDTDGTLITPIDDSRPFQFSKIECEGDFFSQPTSTSSDIAIIDVASDSALVVGITDTIHLQYLFFVLVLFSIGVFLASLFFKR